MESRPKTTSNTIVVHSDHQRKRMACDTLPDNDDVDHRQLQLQSPTVIQPSSALNPSLCFTCVHCHCGCHYAEKTTAATATTIEDADYLDSLPIGYRFDPTDNELITHYLLNKIKNQTLPKNKFSEANVYGDHPKDVVGNYPQAIEGAWYFFTSRNRKYVNGKRPNRKAGSGYWKATGPDKVILDDDGAKIGGKKNLVYHEGHQPNGVKTNWMMQEYVVEGYERQRLNSEDMKLDDYVLCKIYYKAERGKDQVQQPVVASDDRDETIRANAEVENEELALVPYEQSCLSSNEDVNLQHCPRNLNPTSLYVDNHLLNSNQNLRDQLGQVVTNQYTNPANEGNVFAQHLDQNSNPAIHDHVEDKFPIEGSNQHLNPVVQNGDKVVNGDVMVHDQQGCVVSHQDANSPTILRVKNNMVAQNLQDVGLLYDRMTPYTMSPRPLQMTSFQRMKPPLADQYSSLTGFNQIHHLPPTPRLCPPLPPRIVHTPQVHAQPGMYVSGQSSHPPPLSAKLEPPTFQEENECDGVDLFNQFMFIQDGNDAILDDNYQLHLDGDEELDVIKHQMSKNSGTSN